MRHRKGIDLVRSSVAVPTARDDYGPHEHVYSVEVWSSAPEADGELLGTISRATDFEVSAAAYKAAVRQRPGKTLVHLNGRYRMSCKTAPDPPLPLDVGRLGGGCGRPKLIPDTTALAQAFRTRRVVHARR